MPVAYFHHPLRYVINYIVTKSFDTKYTCNQMAMPQKVFVTICLCHQNFVTICTGTICLSPNVIEPVRLVDTHTHTYRGCLLLFSGRGWGAGKLSSTLAKTYDTEVPIGIMVVETH